MAIRIGVPVGTVTWSDCTLFNGTVWLGLKTMIDGSAQAWPQFALAHQTVNVPYPVWTPVTITDGQYNNTGGVTYNEDLNPPGTQYVALYKDASGKNASVFTSAFVVSQSGFTIPAVAIPVPTVGSNPNTN